MSAGYLGLGSNVGDRLGHLRAAVELLDDHGVAVTAVSSVYETEPVGEILDQPDFLNAAVAIETDHGPEELLDTCKAIEAERGRTLGGPRHGPRPLDVDLLLLGELELRDGAPDPAAPAGERAAVRARAAAGARSRADASRRNAPERGARRAGRPRARDPRRRAQAGLLARSGSSHADGRIGGASPA